MPVDRDDRRDRNLWRLGLSSAIVMLLFGVCGTWSSGFYADQGLRANLLGIPFALLCGILFVRSRYWILILAGIAIFWLAARFLTMFVLAGTESELLAMGIGGMFGAVSVTTAISVEHPRLLSSGRLAGAAVVGFAAGLPFVTWLLHLDHRLNPPPLPDSVQAVRLEHAFAIWQAAVGTYIHVFKGERVMGPGATPVSAPLDP